MSVAKEDARHLRHMVCGLIGASWSALDILSVDLRQIADDFCRLCYLPTLNNSLWRWEYRIRTPPRTNRGIGHDACGWAGVLNRRNTRHPHLAQIPRKPS